MNKLPPAGQTPLAVPLGLLLMLGSLAALGPFSIDLYLPALPTLEAHYRSSPAAVQATLSAYFIGLSLGQLVLGPLSDRIGRRPPLLGGLTLYVLASLACTLAPTIEWLIAARLLQALGACAGMVICRAIIRDLYGPQQMARVLSMLLLVMGIAPIIAPMVGGLIYQYLGWQALFLVLAGYGALVMLAVWRWMAETMTETGADRSLRQVAQGYLRILGHRRFMGYALSGGVAQAGLFAYIASSSFVFIGVYQLDPTQYALLFGGVAFGLIAASQVNARLLLRLPAERILRRALDVFLVSGLLLLLAAVSGLGGLWTLLPPLFCAIATLGFGFPNTTAAAMEPFGDRAGMAAALLGMLQFGLAGLSSYLTGRLFDGSAVPMAATLCGCAIVAQVLLRGLVRRPPPPHCDAAV